MRFFLVCSLFVAPLPAVGAASVQELCEWSFSGNTATPVALPGWLPADSLRDALAYEMVDQIAGLAVDLNNDGTTDYIFRYAIDVCGANCQFVVIDGTSRRSLGLLGGSALFVCGPRVNGYPVIKQYGHSSADAGYWSTLVFDGRKYVGVSTVWMEGAALERLFEGLKDVPHGPPGPAR